MEKITEMVYSLVSHTLCNIYRIGYHSKQSSSQLKLNKMDNKLKRPITIRKSKVAPESTIGAWMYTWFVNFNGNWSYTIKATDEGFGEVTMRFKEAGYELQYLSD